MKEDDDGFTWVIQPEEKKENQREREIFQMVLFRSSFRTPLNEGDEGNGLESPKKEKKREGNQLIPGIISFL